MHDSYEAWLADYKLAMANGTDGHGRDPFDLIYEKQGQAEIELTFDAFFTHQDHRTQALDAFLALGYDRDHSFAHGTPDMPGKFNLGLHLARTFTIASADAFRDEVSSAENVLERFDAFDVEWDSLPQPGYPGARPPL